MWWSGREARHPRSPDPVMDLNSYKAGDSAIPSFQIAPPHLAVIEPFGNIGRGGIEIDTRARPRCQN